MENKWIPVSERLPEESGDYLVTMCSGGEYYDVDTSYFCFLDEGGAEWLESGVIAWQPLPEPYKEDKG